MQVLNALRRAAFCTSVVVICACDSGAAGAISSPSSITVHPAIAKMANEPASRHSAKLDAALDALVPGNDEASATLRRAFRASQPGFVLPVLDSTATFEQRRALAQFYAEIEKLNPGFTIATLRATARHRGKEGKTVLKSQSGEIIVLP
jgi:hypothetical protein